MKLVGCRSVVLASNLLKLPFSDRVTLEEDFKNTVGDFITTRIFCSSTVPTVFTKEKSMVKNK